MELFTLFPQPISRLNLEKTEKYKKIYIPKLTKEFKEHPEKCWDWNTNSHCWFERILTMPKELGEDITSAVTQWMQYFGFPDAKWDLTAWWNVYAWDMYQDTHNHIGNELGNNVVSGIYYLQLPKYAKPAVFTNRFTPYYSILNRTGTYIKHPFFECFSAGVESFQQREGDLIMFTPDQDHLAPRSSQQHDELRITMSFNVTITK
tara:strand:+ start:380 stop:994 length:615 start_codon:yes stop_codon:yes gene_type:complete